VIEPRSPRKGSGGRLVLAVVGYFTSGVAYEAVDDETQARFDRETEQRLEQLRTDLEVSARAIAIFADAAGLDASKIPPGSLAELEQVVERVSKAEPPPLSRE
jgi:hypothetical protein